MGIWEWIYSANDAIKRNAPDVTPVTAACRKTYDVSRAATAQVDGAVRDKARAIHGYLSDDQVRDNVTRIAKNISKNGALYIARSYGGGPIIDIVSRSVQDKKADSQRERLMELETKVAKLEEELSSRKLFKQTEIPTATMASKSHNEPNLNVKQRPEEVLHIFMMDQFTGTKILDCLIVPGTGSRRKEKPVSSTD